MKTFAPTATFDDVTLILRLYDMRREPRMRDARQWYAASFKVKTMEEWAALCPPGSEANASFRMVTSYWEMVGSFLTSGVLNAVLFYQSGRELLFAWERVKHLVPAFRQNNKNPLEWKNFEQAAEAYIAWWTAQAPGAYEAFSRRVRG